MPLEGPEPLFIPATFRYLRLDLNRSQAFKHKGYSPDHRVRQFSAFHLHRTTFAGNTSK